MLRADPAPTPRYLSAAKKNTNRFTEHLDGYNDLSPPQHTNTSSLKGPSNYIHGIHSNEPLPMLFTVITPHEGKV